MTSQEIETWISENRPEPPRGSAVGCGESCACAGGTSGTTRQSASCQAAETVLSAVNLSNNANDADAKPCRGCSASDTDLSRPNYETFTEGGIRMSFVTAVDYDHLCHRYDEVCQQLRESEAARGEQMRTIEVLAAEVRAWRKADDSEPIEYSQALGKAVVARANTNAHPPARRLVEEDSNG